MTDGELQYDSRNGLLMASKAYQIPIPAAPGYPYYTETIKHDMGYKPLMLTFVGYQSGTSTVRWYPTSDEVSWDDDYIYISAMQLDYPKTIVIYQIDMDMDEFFSESNTESFSKFDEEKVDFGVEVFSEDREKVFSSKLKQLSPIQMIKRLGCTNDGSTIYEHGFDKYLHYLGFWSNTDTPNRVYPIPQNFTTQLYSNKNEITFADNDVFTTPYAFYCLIFRGMV